MLLLRDSSIQLPEYDNGIFKNALAMKCFVRKLEELIEPDLKEQLICG